MTITKHCWLSRDDDDPSDVDCLCLGTGRFLRAVLVPPLVAAGLKPALIQTRGRSFLEFMLDADEASYPVDTVTYSGKIETVHVPCYGAFSLGTEDDKKACMEFLPKMKRLSVLGIGVTEAGLASSETGAMQNLFQLLKTFHRLIREGLWEDPPYGKIVVLNMDNVPSNGDVIRAHMMELVASDDETTLEEFVSEKVSFLNTMVDRITSHRPSTTMIPRCEPIPAKAIVVSDDHGDLPEKVFSNLKDNYGVVVRVRNPVLIQADIALKLRVANATHTAVVHAMALSKLTNTDALAAANNNNNDSSSSSNNSNNNGAELLMAYLDSFVQQQVYASRFPGLPTYSSETKAAYDDWRARLTHAHFGLSTFFPTLNGAAKGGIRFGPTVRDLLETRQTKLTVVTAYAYAALLRWLTPTRPVVHSSSQKQQQQQQDVYTGWFQGADRYSLDDNIDKNGVDNDGTVEYADGLRHNIEQGWYEFRCVCPVSYEGSIRPLSDVLSDVAAQPCQPSSYCSVVRAYLMAADGGNLGGGGGGTGNNNSNNNNNNLALSTLVQAVATLYARMVAGDNLLDLLQEMSDCSGPYVEGMASGCSVLVDDSSSSSSSSSSLESGQPLPYRLSPIPATSALLKQKVGTDAVASVVASEVASTIAIDLHTHLLPPSHGALCIWGIDELLTYHYLVAEYFMTACTSVTPESFYALNKREQADIIWKALFIDRSPVSEACRGVVSTLVALGLSDEVTNRDLQGIRSFYKHYRDQGLEGAEQFSELVFSRSGVQYAVMTNIPFDSNEAQYWRPKRKEYPHRYRSALRVDPLLSGDRATVEKSLKASGYDITIEGARQYLRDWCDTMKPEYMMASTPHDFVLKEGTLADVKMTGVNEDAMKEPFAFVDTMNNSSAADDCVVSCNAVQDETPSVIDENSDFLSEVLMKVCEERDLPVALKIGAHRGVNPRLQAAGDGVVAFADAGVLARLCSRFPKVLFLATFLSRTNQHEACVLASKFRNLHLYGCWWFCNNPSIIQEMTRMRIEMLGTAFTAQHSDARVLDQLMYKWPHSRAVIARVLQGEYQKMCVSGWIPTREELRRDVARLFGGSYEEYMAKSLQAV